MRLLQVDVGAEVDASCEITDASREQIVDRESQLAAALCRAAGLLDQRDQSVQGIGEGFDYLLTDGRRHAACRSSANSRRASIVGMGLLLMSKDRSATGDGGRKPPESAWIASFA